MDSYQPRPLEARHEVCSRNIAALRVIMLIIKPSRSPEVDRIGGISGIYSCRSLNDQIILLLKAYLILICGLGVYGWG